MVGDGNSKDVPMHTTNITSMMWHGKKDPNVHMYPSMWTTVKLWGIQAADLNKSTRQSSREESQNIALMPLQLTLPQYLPLSDMLLYTLQLT